MNIVQQTLVRQIEERGGRVFSVDVGASHLPILEHHARKKLERLRRYGSHKVKVTIRRVHREGAMTAMQAIAAVRIALGKDR